MYGMNVRMHACMYVCMYVCMHACMHACTMYTYTGVVSYGSTFIQKCVQNTVIWNIAEDATPPVLNQLPYSLKSYDDKAVRSERQTRPDWNVGSCCQKHTLPLNPGPYTMALTHTSQRSHVGFTEPSYRTQASQDCPS